MTTDPSLHEDAVATDVTDTHGKIQLCFKFWFLRFAQTR
jgi:hypothetical protein